MAIQAERLEDQTFIPPWVRFEHLARYEFAAQYVKGKTVIDCACGDGTGSEIFLKAGAEHLLAFDLSDAAVEKAKARCASMKAEAQACSGENLPIPQQFSDVYICLETIEHIEQDQKILQEAVRVLKPEGIFICSTPNRTVTNPGTLISDKPWNQFHIREYSQEEFIALLKSAFCRIELYGQNQKRRLKTHLMESLAKILPKHGAVQLNQIMKFPWLFCDRLEYHRVQVLDDQWDYEYVVAVCREPRR